MRREIRNPVIQCSRQILPHCKECYLDIEGDIDAYRPNDGIFLCNTDNFWRAEAYSYNVVISRHDKFIAKDS